MQSTQKHYEKKVNSGLRPFADYKLSEKQNVLFRSKSLEDSQPTLARFLTYFLIVFIVIAGLSGLFNYKQQSSHETAERLSSKSKSV